MMDFKKLVYSGDSKDDIEASYEDLITSDKASKYWNLVSYLEDVYEMHEHVFVLQVCNVNFMLFIEMFYTGNWFGIKFPS